MVETAVSAENAERHRQIEAGAFLPDVGRREVNGDVGGRNVVAAILQSRANALAALPHRGIGQADGGEVVLVGFYRRNIDFNLNQVRVDAIDGGAKCLVEHAREGTPTTELKR